MAKIPESLQLRKGDIGLVNATQRQLRGPQNDAGAGALKQVAQDVDKTFEGINDRIKQTQDEDDQREGESRLLAYKQRLHDKAYGKEGFKTLKGQQAVDFDSQYDQQSEQELQAELQGVTNPRIKKDLELALRKARNESVALSQEHSFTGRQQARDAVDVAKTAQMGVGIQVTPPFTAGANSAPNPQYQIKKKQYDIELDRQLDRKGIVDPNRRAEFKLSQNTLLHENIINGLNANQKPEEAARYFQMVKHEIRPDRHDEITKTTRSAGLEVETSRATETMFTGFPAVGVEADARREAELAKMPHGALRTSVTEAVRAEQKRRKTQDDARVTEIGTEARGAVEGGRHPREVLKPEDYQRFVENGGLPAAEKRLNDVLNQRPANTNYALEDELNGQLGLKKLPPNLNDPKYQELSMEQWKFWNHAVAKQNNADLKITKANEKEEAKLAELTSYKDTVTFILDSAGVKTKDKETRGAVMEYVGNEILRRQKAHKGPNVLKITQQDYRSMAKTAISIVRTEGTYFGVNTQAVFEAAREGKKVVDVDEVFSDNPTLLRDTMTDLGIAPPNPTDPVAVQNYLNQARNIKALIGHTYRTGGTPNKLAIQQLLEKQQRAAKALGQDIQDRFADFETDPEGLETESQEILDTPDLSREEQIIADDVDQPGEEEVVRVQEEAEASVPPVEEIEVEVPDLQKKAEEAAKRALEASPVKVSKGQMEREVEAQKAVILDQAKSEKRDELVRTEEEKIKAELLQRRKTISSKAAAKVQAAEAADALATAAASKAGKERILNQDLRQAAIRGLEGGAGDDTLGLREADKGTSIVNGPEAGSDAVEVPSSKELSVPRAKGREVPSSKELSVPRAKGRAVAWQASKAVSRGFGEGLDTKTVANLELFMMRMAATESVFGATKGTFRDGIEAEREKIKTSIIPNLGGVGLWQVDQGSAFIDIKTHAEAKKLHSLVKAKFGIDVENLDITDLRKPLHSAVAAMLYLAVRTKGDFSKIPTTLEGQAAFYKKHYNSNAKNAKGSVEKFIRDAKKVGDK